MMEELLDYYSVQGEHLGVMEKKRLHKQMISEYFKKGNVTVRHKDVKLILLTSSGRIVLQRRSKWKGDNPGKWDKTIGGHVSAGDQTDLTMLKECSEELGIPSTVVKEDYFERALSTTNLNILGVLKKLVYLDNFQSKRKTKEGTWIEPSMTQFYIGYYDGPIRFMDSESCGIQVFTVKELQDELKKYPDQFTDDLKYVLKNFVKELKPAPKKIQYKLNY